jgi:hypothetical protein
VVVEIAVEAGSQRLAQRIDRLVEATELLQDPRNDSRPNARRRRGA